MVTVRGSEINDFLRCRKRWSYRWHDGLIPKKQNDKLFFGTLFHRFLEVLYNNGQQGTANEEMVRMFRETDTSSIYQQELDDLWLMAQTVADNYYNHWWENDQNWKVLATELRFEIPLDEHVTFTGTIDLVYELDGKIYFMDHKTTASLDKYEKNSVMDRQISRYWWALQQIQNGKGYVYDKNGNKHPATVFQPRLNGKPLVGFVYNIILKDYPEPPKVLKDGSLSKAKNQKTTYNLFMKAVDDLGFSPDDYKDIIDYLKQTPREFFRRVEVHRLQPEIDASIEEFYYTAMDLKDLRKWLERGVKEAAYRNITNDCSWDCQYKDICVAGFDGSDVNFLVDALYTREEKENV
jgi:hypothetical protein